MFIAAGASRGDAARREAYVGAVEIEADALPKISDRATRRLIEFAAELDRLSCKAERPILDEEASASLMDCGTPLPSFLAVFERHDAIEGCFDEDAQGMLELPLSAW